ncbi:MAG TPA: monovalent cation/H+ antiporter complex subunit F [Thermodesulfobacteriota bacterium]
MPDGRSLVDAAATGGLVVVGLAALALLYRVVRGPTVLDRLVAIDAITVNIIAFVALFGVGFETAAFESRVYLDVALVVAVIAFLATAAVARYAVRPHPDDAER